MTTNERSVLAVNAGSSTVKLELFTFEAAPRSWQAGTLDVTGASSPPRVLEWIGAHAGDRPLAAIGHRLVHGGPLYREPQRVTPALLDTLKQLVPFAPNHLPDEIALIEALGRRWPEAPQVACFDTAFHADLPEVARRLPISHVYDDQGIRRYGFHGLSYAFLVQELARIAGADAAGGRLVLAHMGNGSSLAAVREGRSVDTTMGFTPIGGVVMSTRSGDLDPGVVTYLARRELSADQVEDLLSHEAGLLGISGVSGDMRVLLEREPLDPACRLAVAMYVYSVVKAIGALTVALGGLDTLVFSGGIGEHAAVVRGRICDGLTCLGVQIDAGHNAANAQIISTSAAKVIVRVIPTNEALMIARLSYQLLNQGAP